MPRVFFLRAPILILAVRRRDTLAAATLMMMSSNVRVLKSESTAQSCPFLFQLNPDFAGLTSKLKSTAVAECVRAPMLMTSTPGSA